MSYGIEIINNDDRILIDDQFPFPGYVSTTPSTGPSSTTIFGGGTYTGNGSQQSGDLVIARAPTGTDGYVGKGTSALWPNSGVSPLAFPYSYYLIRNLSGLVSKSTSGYGMEVYGSNGNDVYFTSNISKGLSVVEAGVLNSQSSGIYSVAWPSSTGTVSDLHKHFCLINETKLWGSPVPFQSGVFDRIVLAYRYEWVSGTSGRLHIESYRARSNNLSNKSGINIQFNYVIFKELS